MGNIVMCRVDARLVHGQVAARWTKYLDAKRIVIISDTVANDEFMIELFQLAAPMGTKIKCLTVDDAIKQWNENQFGEGKIIVLFQDIQSAKEAFDKGYHFSELNIGQVPGGPGRSHAVETVSLSPEECQMLIDLENGGAEVYFKSLPDVIATPLSAVRKKYNL
ncbi:MAG: PTS sugar transporter subunit IIB [Erysipelotrichaceae bacterium]|nr:PTS sugar transporter subunit IIB [Erysipelotrichaceae bacterium]